MPVPQEIRSVNRPKNTIVEDRGRDGPKRYAVRERGIIKPKIETISLIHASPRNMIVPFFQTYCLLSVKI